MRTNSAGFQQQIRAPSGEKQREKPKDSKSEHPEDPIYTSARDLEPILKHPQPNWNQYTVTKISEGFDRIDLEASRENEADHQSGANEYSVTGRNTPLRQRSLPKPKVTSTLAPPKNHNNYGLKRKPITKQPAKKSDFTLLSQIEHGNFLATGANPNFQPPPKATVPSDSRPKYKISDIQKKSSNPHRVHSDVASDFNDSRKRTRGQNQGITIPQQEKIRLYRLVMCTKKKMNPLLLGSDHNSQGRSLCRVRIVVPLPLISKTLDKCQARDLIQIRGMVVSLS
ncbi:uncharacterized protein EAF02_011560 [Botrytis sinoallii]|uniref:uncharacterized protein n=1 Tax=Botrytis sinoallii TaxID=1463999 RepID=UPI001901A6CE|nr:uncharacterized protein EAF02_011560 [Botrytis sinoallii]KAF7855301.1 hypothetical protein EAF02_011560 [Botrytis sinoallii]